jgi:UPF0042 nucleotide-binding protein
MKAGQRRVVVVTGLSGAGKGSTLHVLEDLGYEAVDNPPLHLLEELVSRGDRPVAVGLDARSRGFDAASVVAAMDRLRLNPALRPELVFVSADETVLLRRYTETRRRHPMAPEGQVRDGIAAETVAVAPLREAADLVLDTSSLPLSVLRGMVEQRFQGGAGSDALMTVSLLSFAFPQGLPLEADLVFDARFLRNPHYDPILRDKTGLDHDVAAFVEADPDYNSFVLKITDLLSMLLPRFVQEGKKYASVAIGCTGGRHRSVHVVQNLACNLAGFRQATPTWRVSVTHRELMRERGVGRRTQERGAADGVMFSSQGNLPAAAPGFRTADDAGAIPPAQAQEA